jgi:hypothetical protein
MLCKKNNSPNNPVYMDTSEVRLPDGILLNAESRQLKLTLNHSDHVLFLEAYLILSWDI